MRLKLWQVDAFAEKPFAGNPAAVVPLESWLDDALMQSIANENNLSETAFFVPREEGFYDLRWFTPSAEVELCGHATLASAWVIFSELGIAGDRVRFATRSGVLSVDRGEAGHNRMALPADPVRPYASPAGFAQELGAALGVRAPDEMHRGRYLFAVWNDSASIRSINPGSAFTPLLRQTGFWGLIVTGEGDGKPYDCVSRFFAPDKGVFEDPVTGSAHCAIVPYWAKRLGKSAIRAYQASPRGGDLQCTDEGARVVLSGPCALYMRGKIEV